MAKGKITFSDSIDKKVFDIGRLLDESLTPGLNKVLELDNAFKALKVSALGEAEIEKQFKVSEGRKEFLAIKQKEADLSKKIAQAKIAEQKVKQSLIDTERKAIDLGNKKQRQQQKNIRLTEKEKYELRLLNRGKREAAIISSKLSTEYEKQAVRLTQLRRKYKDVALVEGETSKRAKQLRAEILKLDSALKRVDANVGQFQRNVGNYGKAMASAARAARAMASAMGLVGGAYLFVQVMRDAFNRVREFDKAMQNIAGIFRTNRAELQDLEKEIIRVASASIKTSREVAELAESLVTLGKTKEEVIKLLNPVNNLSIGLETTSDAAGEFLIQTINAFGGSVDEAEKYADTIATIRTSTTLDFQKMRDSFQYLTPISKLLNKDLAYTGALIGILADNGLKAESAGRLLGTAQIKLATQGKTLNDALEIINKAYKEGKSELEILTIANDLFGKQASKVGAILALNSDKIELNAQKIRDNGGALDDLVNEQLKSLDAQLKILESAWERYILELNESADGSNKLIKVISFLSSNLKQIFSVIGTVTKAYIAYKIAVYLARLQTALMNKQLLLSRKAALASAKGISKTSLAFARFNKILKANILGLIVLGVTGLIYIFNRLNRSILDTVDELHKSNEEFIRQAEETQSVNTELSKMVDRYEELKNKTKLNSKEQKELNEIVKKIAKNVPGAVTEINKYGEALEINTGKTRDFIAKQNEVTKLQAEVNIKNQKSALEQLKEEQEAFNRVMDNTSGAWVKGFGVIKKVEGALVKVTTQFSKTGKATLVETKLTKEQILAYRNYQLELEKKILTAEKDVEANEDIIASITGVKNARQLANEANEKAIKDAEALQAKKEAEIRSVENLKEKIKALRAEQEGLTLADKKRSIEINKLIKLYQKEIDRILGIVKASRKSDKAQREREAKRKKLIQDSFNLESFILNQKIKLQKELSKNEDKTFKERANAVIKASELELELALKTATTKLLLKKDFSKEEIESLLEDGIASNELRKKLGDEELLIIEEYESKKKQIRKNRDDGIDDLEVEKVKKEAERKKAIKEKALNDEIRKENEAFLKREGIYANAENAVELRERRIADIKKKYALEALNAQVKAIEILLATSKLSADKRAEYEAKLSKLKLEISNITTEDFIDKSNREVEKTREKVEKILDLSSELNYALTDLANSIFDARIQKIDDEIAASDAKYEKLLDNEQLSDRNRKLIEDKREKDREKLEKKKRVEQRKQAVFNKITAVAEAGINTALGMTKALAQGGFILGIPQAAIVGALGAIQLAAILAQPLPRYAKGTNYHPGGRALVGEERPEVVTEPNKEPYIVDKPTVLDLPKGTKVAPSLDKYLNNQNSASYYDKLFKASMLASLDIDAQKANEHQKLTVINNRIDEAILEEAILKSGKNIEDRVVRAINKSLLSSKTVIENKIELPTTYTKF